MYESSFRGMTTVTLHGAAWQAYIIYGQGLEFGIFESRGETVSYKMFSGNASIRSGGSNGEVQIVGTRSDSRYTVISNMPFNVDAMK